jgi:hypothetical protein
MLKTTFFKIHFFLVWIFIFGCLSNLSAQLNSVDIYGGGHKFINPFYSSPTQPLGLSYGVRYNLDFSWEWAALLSVGVDKSSYSIAMKDIVSANSVTALSRNSYLDLGFGLEWQWMTEIRTRMGGGRPSCKGSKAIIMAPFKSYLMGGLNYKMLIKHSDDYSAKSVTNYYVGIGFEWFRIGANASHGNNALVPFTEIIYNANFGKAYSIDFLSNKIALRSILFRFGFKYTFGFPEKKFAWGGKK